MMNTSRELDYTIKKRNNRLEKFFAVNNIPVRIIGNPNTPAIIYKEMLCLSAYVQNFNLHFTDKPFNGKIVKSYKLTYDIDIDPTELKSIILNNVHRAIYNVKIQDELFVAGYNFMDKQTSEGKYPVFARHNYKIYFSKTSAENIIKHFKEDGYNLLLHQPCISNKEGIKFEEHDSN